MSLDRPEPKHDHLQRATFARARTRRATFAKGDNRNIAGKQPMQSTVSMEIVALLSEAGLGKGLLES